MRILFDHSTPAPLRHALTAHVVVEAVERGWETLENGALLDAAEAEGFEIFITADKNIRHQQNFVGRKIAVVILGNAQWPVLRRHVDCRCQPGDIRHLYRSRNSHELVRFVREAWQRAFCRAP
jgi:hypothetical protein